VREAIASAIDARGGFDGTRVLDLYAGTGAMAIEALSRGALDATLIESDRAAARGIEQSLAALGLDERARLIVAEASRAIDRLDGVFDRIFVDPPYAEASAVASLLDALADAKRIADGALVAFEHPSKLTPALGPRFATVSEKRYGDTSVLLARFT
jgi:16S rRNA (guanine966-N2)-methyltransferase